MWRSILFLLIIPLIYSCQGDSLPPKQDFFTQLILDTHQLSIDSLQIKYKNTEGLRKVDSLCLEMYLCLERYDTCHHVAKQLAMYQDQYPTLLLTAWNKRLMLKTPRKTIDYLINDIDNQPEYYFSELLRRLSYKPLKEIYKSYLAIEAKSNLEKIIKFRSIQLYRDELLNDHHLDMELQVLVWHNLNFVNSNRNLFRNEKMVLEAKESVFNQASRSNDDLYYQFAIDYGQELIQEMIDTDYEVHNLNLLKLNVNDLYGDLNLAVPYADNTLRKYENYFNPKRKRRELITQAFNLQKQHPESGNELLFSYINSTSFDTLNYYDSHFIRYALWNFQSLNKMDSVIAYAHRYHDMVSATAADNMIDMWVAKNEMASAYHQQYLFSESLADLNTAYEYASQAYDIQYRVLMEKKNVHLSDVLAINTDRLLEILNQLIKVAPDNNAHKDHVLSIAQLYRDQVLQIGLLKSPLPLNVDPKKKAILNEKEKSLNRLLKNVNEFKNGINLPDPRLDTMFHLVYDIYMIKETISKPEESITVNTSLINYSDLKSDLAKDSSMLMQIIASEASYWFLAVDQDSLYLKEYDKRSADSLLSIMSSSIQLKDGQVRPSLTALYDTYFAPLLEDKNNQKLAIIPDGAFSDLPVSSLIRENDYLLKDYSINYHINIKEAISATTKFVDLDVLDCYSFSDEKSLRHLGKKEYVELPYALQEVQYIDSSYSEQVRAYYTDQATKEQFNQSIANSKIIHIASHAYSSSTNRLESYLVLRNEAGGIKRLYGYELLDESITAPLVVMSACETGAGTSYSGTGVFSLSRDFLRAGADAVIKTNFAINDAATYQLMTGFYDKISQLSIGEALRQSKLEMIADSVYQHPYYWSGIILEGNDQLRFTKN